MLQLVAFFLWMQPLRIAGYNPLNANNECRWLDITSEANGFDFLMLAGTGEKHAGRILETKLQGMTIFKSGYGYSSMSNRSCGTAIAVGKNFRNARFHTPIEITRKARGRGLALRVQSRRCDVTCISVYFPPCPWKRAELPNYRATCKTKQGSVKLMRLVRLSFWMGPHDHNHNVVRALQWRQGPGWGGLGRRGGCCGRRQARGTAGSAAAARRASL